jgi:hypothetical protein
VPKWPQNSKEKQQKNPVFWLFWIISLIRMRYTAKLLWARQGDVHGGATWRLHCAYKKKETKNYKDNSIHGMIGPGALLITFV